MRPDDAVRQGAIKQDEEARSAAGRSWCWRAVMMSISLGAAGCRGSYRGWIAGGGGVLVLLLVLNCGLGGDSVEGRPPGRVVFLEKENEDAALGNAVEVSGVVVVFIGPRFFFVK